MNLGTVEKPVVVTPDNIDELLAGVFAALNEREEPNTDEVTVKAVAFNGWLHYE